MKNLHTSFKVGPISKPLSLFVTLLFIAGLILFGCHKEEYLDASPVNTTEPSNQASTPENNGDGVVSTRSLGLTVDVALQNGRLIFDSEEEFERGMNDLEDLNVTDWNDSIGFFSLWKQFNTVHTPEEIEEMDSLPIDDEALMAVLNPCGIVQINPWIFKLNSESRRVYVLPAAQNQKISLLCSGAPSDPDILDYSFDDDVFGILENGGVVNPESPCQDDCAGKVSKKNDGRYCERQIGLSTVKYERKGKVKYGNWGVWRALKMKFKHKCASSWCPNGDNTKFAFVYEAFWKKKCKGQASAIQTADQIINPFTGQLHFNTYFDNKAVKKFYAGTRCLSDYWVHEPNNPEGDAGVLHWNQCVIDGGGYEHLFFPIGHIFGN